MATDGGGDGGGASPAAADPAGGELQLRRLFREIDTDGGGTLARSEVGALASAMGEPLSALELDEAMAAMDADGSGEVDFDELKAWFAQQQHAGGGGDKLQALLRQRLPRNRVECERELVRVLSSARRDVLKELGFVVVEGAGGGGALLAAGGLLDGAERRRRRAVLLRAPAASAHPLQPLALAHRSQREVGASWSCRLGRPVRARVLELLKPICDASGSTCLCSAYGRVLMSRRCQPSAESAGLPGLQLRWCLCHERTKQARLSGGDSPAAAEHVAQLFRSIDADGSETLERDEIAQLVQVRLCARP
jgi:hypothetical protein